MTRRLVAWWVGLALIVAACTNGEPAVTTVPTGTETSTTAPPADASPTTTASPAPPSTGGGEQSPDQSPATLPPLPERPDPDAVAEEAVRQAEGLQPAAPTTARSQRLAESMSLYVGSAFEGFFAASVDTDGDEVAVVSVLPVRDFRGDPGLPFGLADLLAFDPTVEIEEVSMDGGTAYTFTTDDDAWWVAATNTHLFVTLGDTTSARSVMAALLATGSDAYLWQAGDCVHLGRGTDFGVPYAPFGDIDVVPCDGVHTHEVILGEPLPDGAGAPFPGVELAAQRDAACDEAYEAHIGTLRSQTTIEMVSYMPDRFEWTEGDRYIGCMVHLVDADGDTVELTASLAGTGNSHPFVPVVGECYDDSFSELVDCSVPHLFEVVTIVTHPDPAGAGYPGRATADEWFDERCDEAAFEAGIDLGGDRLTARVPRVSAYEWNRGVRSVACWVGAIAEDGEGLEKVIGSFTGEWRRVGRDGVAA